MLFLLFLLGDMHKTKKVLIFLLMVVVGYVFYILQSTGFFRNVDHQFEGRVITSIPIPGVEDITVDEDDQFAIFISYDRLAKQKGKDFKGAIYFMDLKEKAFQPKLISGNFERTLWPHGISLYQVDSNHHLLYVINHAEGEFIEVFDLYHRDSLIHRESLSNDLIYSPNDIVAISENEFYFTNDTYYENKLGQLAENYLELSKCETVYFDGQRYRVVNDNISYANGINFDLTRDLLYIVSVRSFEINVFSRKENGDIHYVESIDCGTGVDNLELDTQGHIWAGCHPNLLAINGYMAGKKSKAPSEIIKINYRSKGDYTIEQLYLDDGTEMSAASVAAPYQDLILFGNVCDKHFLVLQSNQ